MKIYHLVNEEDIKFTIESITDFSESGKLKQIIKLRETDWSHVQITQRALTFDGDTYNLKSHLENKLAIPKLYYGEDKFMENQFDDDEEEEDQPDDEDAESENDTDEWNIQSVQSISLTTSMIATCHKQHKTFCFVVKPSPGSRKSDIVGFQQIAEID